MVKSTQHKSVYYECYLAEPNQGKALIILGGIPGFPKKNDALTDAYLAKGYNVLYPHYEGTWKSEGIFLERPPSEAIDEFLEYIHFETELGSTIDILASSFGGYVALSLSDKPFIHKIFAMSPIVSFQQVSRIETLENFILKTYPEGYRFKHGGWQNMLEDKLKSPTKGMSLSPEKIVLVAGIEDKQIGVEDLRLFAEKGGIKNFYALNLPHITFSKMNEEIHTLESESFS